MKQNKNFDFKYIMENFDISGRFKSAIPCGSGHINDSFLVEFSENPPKRFILQRINHNVFKDVPGLMENISRVLQHLAKTNASNCVSMNLIKTNNGESFFTDKGKNYWRCYTFIEGARTYDLLENPEQAYHAAKAFGRFQKQLCSLPGEKLHETIKDFHNTPKRFERLEQAIERDALNRAIIAKDQIDFALSRKELIYGIEKLKNENKIPEIITHNDTKINNVLMDDKTGEGICVIDLDTVMPGVSLYDFGDMVRTAAVSANEDEQNLDKVKMRSDIFEKLVKGFIEGKEGTLNSVELENLPISGEVITFEVGIRFLTDFLEGDCYFKIHRPNHNLDRTKTQFKLVESMENQIGEMQNIVKKYN